VSVDALSAAQPTYCHDVALRELIRANIARFKITPTEQASLAVAAVGILIVAGPREEAHFLITRRRHDLASHSGQFALPGGRANAGEGPEATALRELDEELHPTARFEVLGCLDPYPTRSGFLVTPVVAWCADQDVVVKADPVEVASVHLVRLAELDEPGSPKWDEHNGVSLIRMRVLGHFIYAPTAALLYQFREVALHGRPVRVAHFGQPDVTSR
jgi:8-oxo-dGTP pyrophosphatase MutT (NUDIX family)